MYMKIHTKNIGFIGLLEKYVLISGIDFMVFSKNRNFVTTFLFKKIMEHTIQSFSEDQLIYSTCFKI